MASIPRVAAARIRLLLARNKSVLLLGPRQTGKTTLLSSFEPVLALNLLRPEIRQRYERAPHLFGAEVEALASSRRRGRLPLVAVDEVQRVRDMKHLETFLREHEHATRGVVVCNTPRRFTLAPRITAVPWQEIPELRSGR